MNWFDLAISEELDAYLKELARSLVNAEAELVPLRARVKALELPSIELLVTYLPAFYRNFFGTVRPDELALLAGKLQVPSLPSPYSDPSANTVLALRQRFLDMPETERNRFIAFCQALPHRLEVRSEMRNLLEDSICKF